MSDPLKAAEIRAGLVKPLEHLKPHGSETLTKAETVLGDALVWTHSEANGQWFWRLGNITSGAEGSEAACKTMLWATYENHILSALNLAFLDERAEHLATIARLEGERGDAAEAKDGAYAERNQCVGLIAKFALASGYKVGIAKTAIEGWSEDWHGCVYIDLPTGQVSWHYHDRDAELFSFLPAYESAWDGHSTPEKYERVNAAFPMRPTHAESTVASQAERIAALEGALRLAKDMFIANGLDLPHTMEVIDDAFEGRRARKAASRRRRS